MRSPALAVFLSVLICSTPLAILGQTSPPPAVSHVESAQELVARLTPQQKQEFVDAGKAFGSQHYADALGSYKLLLNDLPGDPILAKYASESALNTGDTPYALSLMKPLAQANPDDWQASALLIRAYAESGDKADRDAGFAHMLDLHKRGITPPRLQQYIVERVKAGGKSLLIFTSLEPWGHYQVYNYAQLFDESGHLLLRTTIESNDSDQPLFAKDHPKEAASGVRSFSLDGYRGMGTPTSSTRLEAHSPFKFFIGQPSYDDVRDAFISIATGQTRPMSSRINVLQ